MKVLQKGRCYYKISNEVCLPTCTLSLRGFAHSQPQTHILTSPWTCVHTKPGQDCLCATSNDEGCRLLVPHPVPVIPHAWEPQPGFWTCLLYSGAISHSSMAFAGPCWLHLPLIISHKPAACCLLFLLWSKTVLVACFPGRLAEE